MKLKKWIVAALAIVTTVGLLAGCGADASKSVAPAEKNEITVGINPGYGDQIMDVVKQEAAKQGLKVNVKAFNDYITPNQALANGDIDLNVYQHQPFLDAFNAKNGTNIVSIGKTYLAPLALYSHKYKKVADIPDGSTIAIPNDPTNGSRALEILQKANLIKLDPKKDPMKVTVQDIVDNPHHFKISELEAAQLPRSLDDTAASVINAGYAISIGLNSARDGLAVEADTSPYVNIIAARAQDKDNPTYQKFVKIFQSQAVKDYINKQFDKALIPVW
jgi:D-methionine transport system substrate-binding protein